MSIVLLKTAGLNENNLNIDPWNENVLIVGTNLEAGLFKNSAMMVVVQISTI